MPASEKLGWSRANLYKYVTTKEEIILEIAAGKMDFYKDVKDFILMAIDWAKKD